MDLIVQAHGIAAWGERRFSCTLGAGGVSEHKREGDGATPAGCFPLRRVLFRPDRLSEPVTGLPVAALQPLDAWCDDPADPRYNRFVRQPYAGRFEPLWRADEIYDVIVVVGYNDEPVVPGRGSAIFVHCARRDGGATAGCVALRRDDLFTVLRGCDGSTRLRVTRP